MSSNQEPALTPLGTLAVLPRELRDQIYSHVRNRKYQMGSYQKGPCRKWRSVDGSIISVATFSNVMREELLAVICSEAVFRICDGYQYYTYSNNKPWRRDGIPLLDRIQNLEISATLGGVSDQWCTAHSTDHSKMNRLLSGRIAEPTSFFTGTDVLRNACAIKLYFCTSKTILIMQSPFFDAIKHLTGFKTVVLELSSREKQWWSTDALTYIGEDASYADHAIGFSTTVDAMNRALEPTLGPSVMNEDNAGEVINWWITFRPQDYLSRKRKADTQFDAQVDELAASLNTL